MAFYPPLSLLVNHFSCLLQCNIVCLQERSAAGKKHIQQHKKEDFAEEEEIDSNDDRRKLREDAGATFLSGTDNDLELKTKKISQ